MNQEQIDAFLAPAVKYGLMSGLDMTKVPLAFSKHESEKYDSQPIFLGWEWEVHIPILKYTANPKYSEKLKPGTAEYEPHTLLEGKEICEWLSKAQSHPQLKNLINFGSGGHPVEMRSVPATMKFHREYMRDIFFKEGFNKAFQPSSDCGIHIHMDQKAFSIPQLKKFIAFASNPANTAFIEAIGGRSITGGCNWCTKNHVGFKYFKSQKLNKKIRGHDITIDERSNSQIPPKDFNPATRSFPSAKSVAVHTGTSHGTHEFRIFTSVESEQKFMKNLEFTDALIRYVRASGTTNNRLYAWDFAQFVLQHSADYDYLLKEKALIDQLKQKRQVA